MPSLDQRVAFLEGARAHAELKAMTDDELDSYIRTLDPVSPQSFGAVLAKVLRHPSSLPLVKDDPDYAMS